MGAGLGPASSFLYSGPAINVLAIVLTAKILGVELGIARAVTAVVFSIVLGILMARLFRRADGRVADACCDPAAVAAGAVLRVGLRRQVAADRQPSDSRSPRWRNGGSRCRASVY
jgi:uncharacterized membrane protein YraQ (UPF0718 family)